MIILMGLAGSGKSTQGQILAKEMGRVWLSAGEVLRRTEQFKSVLDAGGLVDDGIVIPMMTGAIAQAIVEGKEIILDGYPRDVEQAEWIAENAADRIEAVFYIEVPKEELMRRIALRKRADDTEEAIQRRFAIVEQNIQAVCEILTQKDVRIMRIDGHGTMEEVTARLHQALIQLNIH